MFDRLREESIRLCVTLGEADFHKSWSEFRYFSGLLRRQSSDGTEHIIFERMPDGHRTLSTSSKRLITSLKSSESICVVSISEVYQPALMTSNPPNSSLVNTTLSLNLLLTAISIG